MLSCILPTVALSPIAQRTRGRGPARIGGPGVPRARAARSTHASASASARAATTEPPTMLSMPTVLPSGGVPFCSAGWAAGGAGAEPPVTMPCRVAARVGCGRAMDAPSSALACSLRLPRFLCSSSEQGQGSRSAECAVRSDLAPPAPSPHKCQRYPRIPEKEARITRNTNGRRRKHESKTPCAWLWPVSCCIGARTVSWYVAVASPLLRAMTVHHCEHGGATRRPALELRRTVAAGVALRGPRSSSRRIIKLDQASASTTPHCEKQIGVMPIPFFFFGRSTRRGRGTRA